jgi:hypothetical protein
MDHEKSVSGQSQQGVRPSQGPASPSAPGWSVPKERPSTVPPPQSTSTKVDANALREASRVHASRTQESRKSAAARSSHSARYTTRAARAMSTESAKSQAKSPRTLMGPGASLFMRAQLETQAAHEEGAARAE